SSQSDRRLSRPTRSLELVGADIPATARWPGIAVPVNREVVERDTFSDRLSGRREKVQVAGLRTAKHPRARRRVVPGQERLRAFPPRDLTVGEIVDDRDIRRAREAIFDGVDVRAALNDRVVRNPNAGRIPRADAGVAWHVSRTVNEVVVNRAADMRSLDSWLIRLRPQTVRNGPFAVPEEVVVRHGVF